MIWLANWCFVRGQNMLIPHAFYYSVRGPRLDERPPDVGPNSKWWDVYCNYADGCRRLSWMNTGSRHICDIAILCEESWLPDRSASILFRNQRDFNYLEVMHLAGKAKTGKKGVGIADMNYSAVIIDSLSHIPEAAVPQLEHLAKSGRLIIYGSSGSGNSFKGAVVVNDEASLLTALSRITSPDIVLDPASEDIRVRHVIKEGIDYYILFNENGNTVTATPGLPVKGPFLIIDPYTLKSHQLSADEIITFQPHEIKILMTGQKRYQ